MSPYTPEELAQIKANLIQVKSNLAKGVTSIELNGEKITFRPLAEMRQIIAMLESDISSSTSSGFYTPSFSRG
ncbi:phage head-tail joining protein [Chachezhania sediminis]|uniref:phage head-tail joining protein n=1 Tax=Chachezhania sediminis TaxID=2599291 RepID=UPI00131E2DA1|nr:hypothetical protein [Chachezhania sediminis]